MLTQGTSEGPFEIARGASEHRKMPDVLVLQPVRQALRLGDGIVGRTPEKGTFGRWSGHGTSQACVSGQGICLAADSPDLRQGGGGVWAALVRLTRSSGSGASRGPLDANQQHMLPDHCS